MTVHGKGGVVVISAEEFRRLNPAQTGADLIAALQASPDPGVDLTPVRLPMPVRDVIL